MMSLTIWERSKFQVPKETHENRSESGCLEMFEKKLHDEGSNLEEKQFQ